MITEAHLFDQLRKADAAGDINYARQVKAKIDEQRSQWSQQWGFPNNDIVNQYGLDKAEQMRQEMGGNYDSTANMSTVEKFVAGVGRGATEIWQGTKQLGMRAGDAVGLVDEQSVKDYDRSVQQEAALFDKGLGQHTSANIGRMLGQTVATAPAGLMAGKALAGATGVNNLANAGRMATAGRMGAQGAGIGAAEGFLQPVLNGGGDFWQDKAVQTGAGAALGGVISGGLGVAKGGKELLDDGVSNTVMNKLSKGSENKLAAAFVGDAAESKATREAAERMGVRLSPAEKSGGKLAQGIEALTEKNLFTADDVRNKSTLPGLDSLKKSVTDYADGLSKQNLSVEQMGGKLQNLTQDITDKLVRKRSNTGSRLYAEVDNIAKGRRVVKTDNLQQVMGDIINENKNVVGSDLTKIANQVKKMKDSIATGGMTAKQAKNQLQAWTDSKGGNLFKDIEAYGVDNHYKKRLRDALLADMDNAADEIGGNVGEKMRAANQFWRESSEEIESFGNSLLGRTAGKELSSNVIDMAQNKIPPEKVIDSFRTAKPSQVKAAIKYMDKFDPSTGMQFRAHYLKNAVEEAMMQAPSAGAESVFNPAQFLNALGIKSGKAGIEGVEKLKAILGDVKGGKQWINDVIRVSRTKADAFGRNFSGTAAQNQAYDLLSSLGSIWSGLMTSSQKVLGTAGNLMGVKAAAKAVIGGADDFVPSNIAVGSGFTTTAPAWLTAPVVGAVNNEINRNP